MGSSPCGDREVSVKVGKETIGASLLPRLLLSNYRGQPQVRQRQQGMVWRHLVQGERNIGFETVLPFPPQHSLVFKAPRDQPW